MRRWLTARVLGAALAVSMIVVSASPAAAADPRDFDLINNTGMTIDYIYVSPTSVDDWGDDVLGQDVLDHGQVVHITFPGGRVKGEDCIFDIKVMLTDEGKEGKLDSVDLCATRTVTFN
jgi:hypothetical protein